jgi:hypothetical protein
MLGLSSQLPGSRQYRQCQVRKHRSAIFALSDELSRVLNAETGDDLLSQTGMTSDGYAITVTLFSVAYAIFEIPSNYCMKHYVRPSVWLVSRRIIPRCQDISNLRPSVHSPCLSIASCYSTANSSSGRPTRLLGRGDHRHRWSAELRHSGRAEVPRWYIPRLA